MDMMKNQEGYRDPTACRAIRNAFRKKNRRREVMSRPLTYRLEEIHNFRACMPVPGK